MGGSFVCKVARRSRIILRLAVSTALSFGKPKIKTSDHVEATLNPHPADFVKED